MREFFYNPDTTTENIEMDAFKQKSKWIPSTNRQPTLERYLTFVKREVLHTLDHRPHSHRWRDNLTPVREKGIVITKKKDRNYHQACR